MSIFDLSAGNNLRDYQHASKTFASNNHRLLPKTKRWFHVYFEISPDVFNIVNDAMTKGLQAEETANNQKQVFPGPSSRLEWDSDQNDCSLLGVLVKSVKLPSFKFEVKKHNQYNRTSLSVDKINYDPIEIAFHDDTINIMNTFWYAYYQYMNQDAKYSNYARNQVQGLPIPSEWDQPASTYSSVYNSTENFASNWGMDTVEPNKQTFGRDQPFFKSIRIYQFNRSVDVFDGASYNEFVLVNPVITGFNHSNLDYSSSDFTDNTMSIEYETVLYNQGLLKNDEIASWEAVKNTFFDNTASPLGNLIVANTAINTNILIESAIESANQTNSAIKAVTTYRNTATSTSINNIVATASLATEIAVPFISNIFKK